MLLLGKHYECSRYVPSIKHKTSSVSHNNVCREKEIQADTIQADRERGERDERDREAKTEIERDERRMREARQCVLPKVLYVLLRGPPTIYTDRLLALASSTT